MDTFNQIKDYIKAHLDDPDSLSKAIIGLTAYLYTHNQETAEAGLEEEATIVTLLDNTPENEKKISMTEAEARAKVMTKQLYKKKMLEAEAITELVNAVKVRISVLSWERKNS